MLADLQTRPTLLRRATVGVGGFAARRPVPVLLVVGLVTAALLPPALDIDYDDDVISFLPEGDAEVRRFREMGDRFHGLSIALIGVEAPEGDLFTPERLRLMRSLTRDLREVPGVGFATGLTELRDLVVEPSASGEPLTVVSDLVGEIPASRQGAAPGADPGLPEQMAALRRRVLSREHVRGALISEDGAAALILFHLEPDAPVKEVADGLRTLARKLNADAGSPLELHFGGAPFVGSYVAEGARRDIARLSPWVGLAIVLIILFTARSALGSIIALASVGIGLVWVVGAMSLLHRPLTLVSASLPMLMLALGSAYSIHLLAKVLANMDEGAPDRRAAVREAVADVGPPIAVAGLTTALGFASFLVMNIEPMREFGLWMAVATLLVVVLGLLLVPASCVLLPLRPRSGGRAPRWVLDLLVWGAASLAARPRGVIVVILLVVGGTSALITQVDTRMDMRAFFQEDSEPVRAEDFLQERLGGSIFLQVDVQGDLRSPLVLRRVDRLAARLRAEPGVSGVRSVLDPLLIAAEGLTGARRVPASATTVRALAKLLDRDPNLRLLVDATWTHALIQVKLAGGDTRAAVDLARGIREDLATRLGGRWIRLPRGELDEAGRDLELDLVADDAAVLLGAAGAERSTAEIRRALAAKAPASGALLAEIRGRLRADLLEDELIYLRPGTGIDALAREIEPLLAEGRLSAGVAHDILARVASAEDLEDDAGFRKAVDYVWKGLVALGGARRGRARLRALLALAPEERREGLRDPLGRTVAVLDDPFADLPAEPGLPGKRPGATPVEIAIAVSGFPLVYAGMNAAVRRNQTYSLLLSSLLVVLALAWFFRSLTVAVAAALPAGITLMCTFGLMGALQIPMDVGTSMVASIALGVGIDYAVHLVWRHGVPEPGQDLERLRGALQATGWGIVINALEVTVGLGLLALGSIVPMQNVGILTAAAMLLSAALTLLLIPTLMGWVATLRGPRPDLLPLQGRSA